MSIYFPRILSGNAFKRHACVEKLLSVYPISCYVLAPLGLY